MYSTLQSKIIFKIIPGDFATVAETLDSSQSKEGGEMKCVASLMESGVDELCLVLKIRLAHSHRK